MTDAFHNFHPQYQQYTQYSASKFTLSLSFSYLVDDIILCESLGGSVSRGAGGRPSRNGTFDTDESGPAIHRTTPTLHPAPSTSNAIASPSVPVNSGGAATSSFSTTIAAPNATTSSATAAHSSTSSAPAQSGNGGPVGVPPSRLAYTEKTMLLSSDDEFQWALKSPVIHRNSN